MSDPLKALSRYRLPMKRSRLQKARDFTAPALHTARQNPLVLIGAVVVGAAGVLAWRNREKIASKTAPLITEAKTKGSALLADAKAKGKNLLSARSDATPANGAPASTVRPAVTPQTPVSEVH